MRKTALLFVVPLALVIVSLFAETSTAQVNAGTFIVWDEQCCGFCCSHNPPDQHGPVDHSIRLIEFTNGDRQHTDDQALRG